MSFGKYKGRNILNVPDDYLYYLYEEGISENYAGVHKYIQDNINIIKHNLNKNRWFNKVE
jgi:uncharacterized protein (DUF3820 family)